MHNIDFTIPCSGSFLFDIQLIATAKTLCTRFPGLDFTSDKEKIHISGELNDHWYDEWTKAVFNSGR